MISHYPCSPSASCRDDLVQVGNGPGNHTLTVRTINVGLTLLSVSDSGNMGVADYIPIPVEHAIHPQEAHRLVVGDVVCFSVQLTGPDGEWRTFCVAWMLKQSGRAKINYPAVLFSALWQPLLLCPSTILMRIPFIWFVLWDLCGIRSIVLALHFIQCHLRT